MTYQFKEQKECDLVVIGGGGGGLVAAARAAWLSNSKKKVILLEKSSHVGGSGVYAGAIRTFGSKWQKEHDVPDLTQEFILRAMEMTYWRLDSHVVASCVRATGEFFDWFCEAGDIPADRFEVGYYAFDAPELRPLAPMLKGRVTHKSGGYLIMETMVEICNNLGVEILTNHPVMDVELKDGKIVAVIAETPNGHVRVTCKACVLASGSWVSDKEVMKKIAPVYTEMDTSGNEHHNPNLTGDGIDLAKKVGAAVDYDSFCMRPMGPGFRDGTQVMGAMGRSPCSIVVNLNGKRWSCEPVQVRMGFFNGAYVLMQQPKGICYAVFDENTLAETIKLSRSKETLEAPPPVHTTTELASGAARFSFPKFPETMEEVYANIDATLSAGGDSAFKADTIEELAGKIGVDPRALKETVDTYNASCEAGMDWDYFKPAKYLVPMNKGPYYAVKGTLASDGAFGGVPVDPDMQAYKEGGGLVEGLYVVGDCATGKHICMSGIKVQVINDASWAFASGFIAGNSANKYLESL